MSATAKFTPGQPERRGFYVSLRFLVDIITKLFFGLDIQGLEHIPASGAIIVVSNHLSFWDIPSIAVRPRRMFHFMAKSEYARNSFARWLFTKLETFFVRRGEGDMEAIRNALAVLKAGQVLVIYPEGHRTEEHALIEAHSGFTLIALRSGAPVIPVATWGSEKVGKGVRFAFFRPTIHIRYGTPITFPEAGKKLSKDDLQQATTRVMGTVAAMLPPQYRGFYASLVAAPQTAQVTSATEPTTSA